MSLEMFRRGCLASPNIRVGVLHNIEVQIFPLLLLFKGVVNRPEEATVVLVITSTFGYHVLA